MILNTRRLSVRGEWTQQAVDQHHRSLTKTDPVLWPDLNFKCANKVSPLLLSLILSVYSLLCVMAHSEQINQRSLTEAVSD